MEDKQFQLGEEGHLFRVIKTHISLIKSGDTILHYGKLKTVCNSNIKRAHFMGISIFGDSYRSGYKPVELVEFFKPELKCKH